MFSLFQRSTKIPLANRATSPEADTLSGYEASLLVDVVLAKTKALSRENLGSMQGAERTMLSVLLAERLTKSKPLRVLDFGGACGFHYMAADLINMPLHWAVVETPAMAQKASELSSESLQFFSNIPDAINWCGDIDLMFSSGALQSVDDPDTILRQLVSLRAPMMAWSRLAMTDGHPFRETQKSRLADNGPGPLPSQFKDQEVCYSRTYLSETYFTSAHNGYELILRSGDMKSAEFLFVRMDLRL